MRSHGRIVRPRSLWLSFGLTLGLLGTLLVATATPARAAQIVVDTLDGGAVVDNDECALREAIINANGNNQSGSDECAAGSGADTITFSVTGTIFLDSELPNVLAAGGTLAISGPGAGSLTISGDTNNDDGGTLNVRIVEVDAGASLDLSGVTISEGRSAGDGGGIRSLGTLSVTSSVFSNNVTTIAGGGGIYSEGTLTVTSSTLSGNSAGGDGGGIMNFGTLTVTNSTFSGNSATSRRGGGIYSEGTLTVTSSTLSGNTAALEGGGIYNRRGSLDVSNSTFSGNTAIDGGGIWNLDGTSTIAASTFSGNTATADGGGINNFDDGSLTITDSTLSGNTAGGDGGGIFNYVSALSITVTDSTFSSNGAGSNGGGIFFIRSPGSILRNSTFSGNTAGLNGGGIYNTFFSLLDVTNSTFSGNTASLAGGGIFNGNSHLTVEYSTLSGNSANIGGGISSQVTDVNTSATLRATIVANSPSGGNCSGSTTITDGGYNLSSDFSCGFGATSQAGTNPLLQPLDDNGGPTQTMALPGNSPAADVIPEGLPPGAGCGTTIEQDQRGEPRPEDDLCEIGAYEIQDPAPAPPPPPPAPGPVLPPDAISMSPTSGPVGTQVVIAGTNLSGATVRFNAVVAPVSSNTATQIVTTVPQGATTGQVVITTAGGTDSPGTFTVTLAPAISGFAPTSGQVWTSVVISGTNFTGTTVSFGGVGASFVVDSPTQITATVPAGAGTGPIVVTTAQGAVTSSVPFVVRHARTSSLHFSTARGSVSVTDGWSECASTVPVKLQRSQAGEFRTVATDSTNANGAYRFDGIGTSPGRYRVVAKKVTLPTGDVCLKGLSAVVRR